MKLSVRTKLTTLTTGAVIITALALASLSARREFSSITEELERRGLMVCELSSKIVADQLYTLNISEMHAALMDVMRFSDTIDAVITEASGRVVAAAVRTDSGVINGFETSLMYRDSGSRPPDEPSAIMHQDRLVVRYPIKVSGRSAGQLKISFSLDPTRKRVLETKRSITSTGLFWASIVIALSLAGAGRLTRPLAALTAAARALGSGDLDARVNVKTSDEYEDLGEAFNIMAEDLKKGVDQLKYANMELDRNLKLLRELHAFSVKLSSIFDIDELLLKCVSTLCEVLNSNRCSLLLRRPDDEGWFIKVARGIGDREITKNVPLPEEGVVAAWVAKHKIPLLVVDSATDERIANSDSGKYKSASFISTPLIVNTELIGILSVTDKSDDPAIYTEWELSALTTFANQVAVAIENSRLHKRLVSQSMVERELELARDIQTNLLPAICPEISGLEIAAYSRPATAVGGDFYDFMLHDDKYLTSIIGDVSGKGMPAAILMAMTKGFMRPQLVDRDDPADVLYTLNDFVFEQMNCTKFLTMFLAQLELSTNKLRFCNGGHNYPLLIHADGTMEYLHTSDALVGMFPGFEFHCSEIQLKPGDVLVAFTDGLTESMNNEEQMLTDEAVESAAIQMRHLPAETILDKLFALALDHTGDQEQFDDITAFVLKVGEKS